MNIVTVNKEIFREYDIRGIYGTDLTQDVAYTIGLSFGSYIKKQNKKQVIIGHDNRLSSDEIHDALIKGLLEAGVNIIDLGLVTTPMYYFAKKLKQVECGIMITASHNPKEYNGFKISFDHIGNAYGKEIYDFLDFTLKKEFDYGEGFLEKFDVEKDYKNLIKNSLSFGKKKIKAIFDCGNGTGSIIIEKLLADLPIEAKFINCTSDPNFPNHHPDPSVRENQEQLAHEVKKHGFDIGIGIDGDADRVGIVDNLGNILGADIYMVLIYRFLAPYLKEKRAIYDVKCSKTLIDDLNRLGYDSLMYRTGNSIMNKKINQDNYLFGGEYSGHVWFRDTFPGFDDGIYAGLRAISILSFENKPLNELLCGLNHYESTDEEKIKVADNIKFDVVKNVLKYCQEKNYEYSSIDGVRVNFPDGWALVRASNTGPNLTVRFEALTKDRLTSIKEEFTNEIGKILNELSN